MDTFDLLLLYPSDSGNTLDRLNKLLTPAPLMWTWEVISDGSRIRENERMVLVRVTPASPEARDAIASRLTATHAQVKDTPLRWFRINHAPIVEEEDTPRQHAMNMGLQYRDDPQNINLASFVDAVVAFAVAEAKIDLGDALVDHYREFHKSE